MKRGIIISVFVTISALTSYSQHNTYYVGHSGFGWDLIVGEMVNDLAADAGILTYDYNFQFIGGTCLTNQWFSHSSPQGGTDSHVELATGNYDVLVLAEQIPIQEVLLGSQFCNENILTSYESVDNFYDLAHDANPGTQVYLMEFHNEIDQTSPTAYEDWVALNAEMRALWEQLADSVSEVNNGRAIGIVPVSAAFQAMVDSVNAGVFPGITNWIDLFDPADALVATIHPTEVTYYLAACVHFATIFGQSPVGLTNETFAAAGWQFDPPTEAQTLMMQEIAWQIVDSDPYASPTVVLSLGDDQQISDSSLAEVFPNPFVVGFTIKTDEPFYGAVLSIYDVLGREVRRVAGLNGTEFYIDRGDLDRGVHFFQLRGAQGHEIKGRLVAK